VLSLPGRYTCACGQRLAGIAWLTMMTCRSARYPDRGRRRHFVHRGSRRSAGTCLEHVTCAIDNRAPAIPRNGLLGSSLLGMYQVQVTTESLCGGTAPVAHRGGVRALPLAPSW